jgi:membrane protease subunit HflK
MPWNQPGGDDKDPWSGGSRNQGPPDLDELLKKITGRFGGLGRSGEGKPGSGGFFLLAVVALAVWLFSGFFIIKEGERGLVLRFGQFNRVANPGLGWHFPVPVERMERVDVERSRSFTHSTNMLTKDENIVKISLEVQYRIKDPYAFQYSVVNPEDTLGQAAVSALREAVGKSEMDFVLNPGRAEIAASTADMTQQVLDQYKTGLQVNNVNLTNSQPPDEVQAAFSDAIKAREDKERKINEAQAYSNGVIPVARGEAARQLAEANAYKERVISEAEGDASRFSQLLVEYRKAPEVTRERLYLETVEAVLSSTSKVVLDSKQGNSLMYLPLDKIIGNGANSKPALSTPAMSPMLEAESSSVLRQSERGLREGR